MRLQSSSSERWLSTQQVAVVMDCHAQTVRDRCARGELPFTVDASTGHRRIDAAHLEALGYDLSVLSRRQPKRRGAGFHASLTAEVEGALDDEAVHVIAD
jgi:hypothetical protein